MGPCIVPCRRHPGICTCVYTWSLPGRLTIHLICSQSKQPREGVCAAGQDTHSLYLSERETGLRMPLGAEEWVQRALRVRREENRDLEAFPVSEEATDLDK